MRRSRSSSPSLAMLVAVILVAGMGAMLATSCAGGVAGGDDAGPGHDDGGTAGEGEPDGSPNRVACTNTFASAVTAVHGRLDGFLAAVIAPGHGGCRADSDHLHLQIDTGSGVVDVAVNLDVLSLDVEHAPVHPWIEGWHPNVSFDYVGDLAEHAAAFAAHTPAENAAALQAALADANHISVYATGYDVDGVHDVHRTSGQRDGGIVLKPTEATARYLAFRFSDQTF